MTHRLAMLAGLAILIAAGTASAHHSGAMYDAKKELTIEGLVTAFEWTNPHSVLRVVESPQPGQAPTTWVIGLSSPGNLTRSGWTKRTFKAGDRVKVTVSPLRSGEPGGYFLRAILLDSGKEVRAPSSAASVNSTPNLE